MVTASDLRLDGRDEFNLLPPHYRSVGTGMADRLWAAIPSRVNRPPRPIQPPTLCGTGNEYRPKWMMRCGWGVKAGWLILIMDQHVCPGPQVKLCDPSLTRAILSAVSVSFHKKALYKCPVFKFNSFNFCRVRSLIFLDGHVQLARWQQAGV